MKYLSLKVMTKDKVCVCVLFGGGVGWGGGHIQTRQKLDTPEFQSGAQYKTSAKMDTPF